jgi:hypothetical protein
MSIKAIPWNRPLRQPMEEIFLSLLDGTQVYRWQPMSHLQKATRICIPADVDNNKLWGWNQTHHGEYQTSGGNPWRSGGWLGVTDGRIGNTLINTGSSVKLWRLDYVSSVVKFAPRSWEIKFNWTHTKASDLYSYEFYVDNDLEETDPTVLYDDDESYWSLHNAGSGSYEMALSEETTEKAKGTSSLQIDVGAGSYEYGGWSHTYAPDADWSDKDFICFYFYGANSGDTFRVYIVAPDWSNYMQYDFVDNFSGWKRLVIPFNNFTEAGSPDLSTVDQIYLEVTFSGNQTWYFDRTLIDVGQWVKIEAFVPDTLREGTADIGRFDLMAWNGSIYQTFMNVRTWTWCWGAGCVFLDGTTSMADIASVGFGDGCYFGGYCPTGASELPERGDVVASVGGGDTNAPDITYSSNYGCKKRIGFVIKMPPDDGQDASDAGISQLRLKLVVYYTDSGKTTYEFQDALGDYWGLRQMNESWLAAFDTTTKMCEFLVFSKRPTGLEVRADEDDLIDRVDLTLAKGTRVFVGSLIHGNLMRDSDSDAVPDFLSGGKPTNEVDPTVIYEDDESFWSAFAYESGSFDIVASEETTIKQSGISSLKIVVSAGSYAEVDIRHVYDPNADWSDKKYLCLWWYGASSGETQSIRILCPDWSNYKLYNFVENWNGWKRLVISFDEMTDTGSPDMSDVDRIMIWNEAGGAYTSYLDRTVIDVESRIGIPYIVRNMFQGGFP